MEFLQQVTGDIARVVVVSLFFIVAGLLLWRWLSRSLRRGRTRRGADSVEVTHLNRRFQELADGVVSAIEEPVTKGKAKAGKRRLPTVGTEGQIAAEDGAEGDRPRVFVLEFEGDISASNVATLREEISVVLRVARPNDQVVVRLESVGGLVHAYGLAAAQLDRLREAGVTVTVCVDKVAASGGYMMACVADRIVAAPFAVLGSIGVVAPVPNLHRLLQRFDIDYEEMTAGEFKRTVSTLAEITEEGREKFQESLEETHALFKSFVLRHRPHVDIDEVATGEHWPAIQAAEHGLVDEIATSDAFIAELLDGADVFELRYEEAVKLRDRIPGMLSEALDRTLLRWWDRTVAQRYT